MQGTQTYYCLCDGTPGGLLKTLAEMGRLGSSGKLHGNITEQRHSQDTGEMPCGTPIPFSSGHLTPSLLTSP